jgi:hypothetical protein
MPGFEPSHGVTQCKGPYCEKIGTGSETIIRGLGSSIIVINSPVGVKEVIYSTLSTCRGMAIQVPEI